MKEQFTTYEIAVVLKEIGFDEECFAFFIIHTECQPASYSREGANYPKNSDLIMDWISAPLWQQAQAFIFKKLEFHYPTLHLIVFSDGSGEWIADRDVWQQTVLCEALEIEFNNKEEMILKAIEQWKKEQ